MDTGLLTTFLAVARAGSFASVARARGVDPSSVSRAVVALEARVGTRLFQRTTRRLALTEAGRRYAARLEPLLEELAAAEAEASQEADAVGGTVRVTASVAFGVRRLVPALKGLREDHPALVLVAERIDVAIRLGHRPASGTVGARLGRTRYHVCASPAYAARQGPLEAPADLARHGCLVFDLPGFRKAWRFRAHGVSSGGETVVPITPAMIVSNALGLRQAALAGHGPALLADWLIDDDLASNALVDLLPGFEATASDYDTGVWLLYPSRTYLPRKVRAVIDALRAGLRRGAEAPA